MSVHTRDTVGVDLESSTVESLQELLRGLKDSREYMLEAADSIKEDDLVANTLRTISAERQQISEQLATYISLSDEQPDQDGTFLGKLRQIWTSLRAGLNSGDAKVVLIEAERAEDAIVHKFEQILPGIAGNPINDELNRFYTTVKAGHDRVLELRNKYQNAD